ncbi:RNA-binding protein [Exiguobacterium sp. SH31]|uniref:ASCH domain-containing protein n=1 Tax=unclassified Exiguobacterium TaxID=2644629 RepID=UPI0008D54BA9|nr:MULTISPECIES: ASCH domain-containing protein [unclassified Exiguobacterium]OGX78267.1 RNA-binding protein [Exiguobacterium sp. SH31]TCI72136.1 ASCH domain-containing protein [Exiguobacterium sp. SH0S7]
MNEQTISYWNQFWEQDSTLQPDDVEAFQFGDDANHLAKLVTSGQKTATCSAYILYEIEQEPLPYVGQYAIVLDATDHPVAIIRTTEVTIQPMNEISEDFVLSEGEGDYAEWWHAHKRFFTDLLSTYQRSFTEDMKVVCERFEVVHQI